MRSHLKNITEHRILYGFGVNYSQIIYMQVPYIYLLNGF